LFNFLSIKNAMKILKYSVFFHNEFFITRSTCGSYTGRSVMAKLEDMCCGSLDYSCEPAFI